MTDEELLELGRYLYDMAKEMPPGEWFSMRFAFKIDAKDGGLYIDNFSVVTEEE